jgi:hypothetical protein
MFLFHPELPDLSLTIFSPYTTSSQCSHSRPAQDLAIRLVNSFYFLSIIYGLPQELKKFARPINYVRGGKIAIVSGRLNTRVKLGRIVAHFPDDSA